MGFSNFLGCLSINGAVIISSLYIPRDNDIEGLKTTQVWRYITGFPLVFSCISIVILKFFIKHDPPRFLISKGDLDGALLSIKHSYDKSEDPEEVLEYLKANLNVETDKVTFGQAIVDPKYRKATFIMMIG